MIDVAMRIDDIYLKSGWLGEWIQEGGETGKSLCARKSHESNNGVTS